MARRWLIGCVCVGVWLGAGTAQAQDLLVTEDYLPGASPREPVPMASAEWVAVVRLLGGELQRCASSRGPVTVIVDLTVDAGGSVVRATFGGGVRSPCAWDVVRRWRLPPSSSGAPWRRARAAIRLGDAVPRAIPFVP